MISCLEFLLSQVPKSGPGAPRVGTTSSGQKPSTTGDAYDSGLAVTNNRSFSLALLRGFELFWLSTRHFSRTDRCSFLIS
jgi:hypothetical protein